MKFRTRSILIEPSIEGGIKVSFTTHDASFSSDIMHKYEGKDYEVTFKEYKKKRSLDANAYMWVLAGKIANHPDILISKEEVYKQAIRDYGVSEAFPVRNDLMEYILQDHVNKGLGYSFDIIGPCKNYEGYTNVMFYYGSSGYDSAKMSKLIDGMIEDAKDLGIETLPAGEIERMKREWG